MLVWLQHDDSIEIDWLRNIVSRRGQLSIIECLFISCHLKARKKDSLLDKNDSMAQCSIIAEVKLHRQRDEFDNNQTLPHK